MSDRALLPPDVARDLNGAAAANTGTGITTFFIPTGTAVVVFPGDPGTGWCAWLPEGAP
jgi:hypothetical protein